MAPYSSSMEVYFNGTKQTSAVTQGPFPPATDGPLPGIMRPNSRSPDRQCGFRHCPQPAMIPGFLYASVLFNNADSSVGSMKITDDYSSLSLTGANYGFSTFARTRQWDLAMNSRWRKRGVVLQTITHGSYFQLLQARDPQEVIVCSEKGRNGLIIATVRQREPAGRRSLYYNSCRQEDSTTNPITLNVLQAAY